MMLRTYLHKLGAGYGLFHSTTIKNLGIMILLSIGMLLYCPGYILATGQFPVLENEFISEPFILEFSFYLITFGAVAAVMLVNIINFMFLYQKRSSDVFHALPLTRITLLISRAASSFVTVLVPVIIGYAAHIGLTLSYGPMLTGTINQILSCLLITVILMLVFLSMSMFFIVCAGSAFDLVISFGGSTVALMLLSVILDEAATSFIIGYSSNLHEKILEFLSPVYYCLYGASNFADSTYQLFTYQNGMFIIRCVIYMALFFVLSGVLYNRRKAERGGQAYAYKFIFVICAFLASICGGFLLGTIFASDYNEITFWIFAFIGAIVTAIVYGAVTNRGFKRFKESAVIGACSIALLLVSVLVMRFGFFGFASKTPKAEKVERVVLIVSGETIEYKNPKTVIDIHKRLSKKDYLLRGYEVTFENIESITFEYELENGKELVRYFRAPQSKAGNMVWEILKSDERFDSIIENTRFFEQTDINVEYWNSLKEANQSERITIEQFKDFLENYKKDLQSISYSQYVNIESEFYFSWEKNNGDNYEGYGYNLPINERFENSFKYLEDNNLVKTFFE